MGQSICGCTKAKEKRRAPIQLTEKEIRFLLERTTYDRVEIHEWHTQFLKDCPDGTLNKKMFLKQYRKFNPNGKPEKLCDHVFRAFDADKNGFIDFNEFLISISLTSTDLNYKKKLEWVFNLYDIDANGTIDKDEFRTIIEAIYKVLDVKQHSFKNVEQSANDLFQQIDTDKSKTISLEEFVKACTKDRYLLELLAPSV
ncbi:neuronal calcium sensor 2 [Brachionus plicatilis]|uniref:Neuronal calcium sensor 2 n=1 Tax=Brachionus plicatilis TaxID=10195 RepID=A0A3M7QIT1_BRAPC|nr:neuronal calcium sensor 2 [Brachionus plicatilis]